MKYFKFWFPVILYSGIIFLVSSLPNVNVSLGWRYTDKVLHGVEYAILGFLFARALRHSSEPSRLNRSKMIWLTVLFCFLYGASDEFHQSFVIGRSADLSDHLADVFGGFLGSILYRK